METTVMQIKVLRLGHSARHVDIAAGTTIDEVLSQEALPTAGYAISVNGLGASHTTALAEGDVVTLVPKVEGGGQ
jgi:sulfur carrier protein ThiS